MTDATQSPRFIGHDTWQWWEARRLRYNLALATAGWIAFGLAVAILYAFGQLAWISWSSALGRTLFLGIGFLAFVGVANICYLIGAIAESIIKPTNLDSFRRSAYALGFWGSLAAPFFFPLSILAMLLAGGSAEF
jgi:hypothetical protein